MIASPVLRMSIGLVGLLVCVLLLSDMFLGLYPDAGAARREHRDSMSGLMAAELLTVVPGSPDAVERKLTGFRKRVPGLVAISLRDRSGELIAASGMARVDGRADVHTVAIDSEAGSWGRAQFVFESPDAPAQAAPSPWLFALVLGLLVGAVYLFLRRAFLFLDPMSVVPARLRAAFDSMTEGIALLDAQHRVVLGNAALRQMAAVHEGKLHGRRLEDATPLVFGEPMAVLPWQAVADTGKPMRALRVAFGTGDSRRTGSMNCAPILDGHGKLRGCLVTVADMTAIEHANAELRSAMAEVERAHAHIETQNKELVRLAMNDGLTGLLNRRAFFQSAGDAISRHAGKPGTVAVLMLDVDHFKSFNDRFGHAIGDVVLQRVARCLADSVRFNDLVARYGGEEFCVLVQDLDPAGVLALAERIRKAVQLEAGAGAYDGADLTVTISIGVAMAPPVAGELSVMVRSADAALYAAKHGGRNRVAVWGVDVPGVAPQEVRSDRSSPAPRAVTADR
jgi:diguanylate cyclase (GGDEF)-like protein